MGNLTETHFEVVKIISTWADQFPCIHKVYVFGSFARGDEAPSDIDVAVEYIDDISNCIHCYRDVSTGSVILERSLRRMVSAPVGWTGLAALRDEYDQIVWTAIHSGKMLYSWGKAEMILTSSKSADVNSKVKV